MGLLHFRPIINLFNMPDFERPRFELLPPIGPDQSALQPPTDIPNVPFVGEAVIKLKIMEGLSEEFPGLKCLRTAFAYLQTAPAERNTMKDPTNPALTQSQFDYLDLLIVQGREEFGLNALQYAIEGARYGI